MPTSVGPKTYGEENLVFGFDTGDTANSYKGEPTENSVDAFPGASLPSGFYWTYEYSASISDSPIGNHFLSNKKWVQLTKTSSTNGRVMFNNASFTSGSTYTWSCYVYCDDSRNTSLNHGSDNSNYSQRTSYQGYDFTKLGTVQRLYGTWNQLQNGGSIFGIRGGSTNAIGSTFYMTGLQVEENGHPTQLTTGIRSANSGSLIDLKGDSTIDLTNVSFDSNAQMTFDGTDDIINTGLFGGRNPSTDPFTVEAWVKSDTTSGNRMWVDATNNGTGQRFYSALIDSANSATGIQSSAWSDPTPNHTNWTHQVIVMDGSNANCYADGVLKYQLGYTSYTLLSGGLNIGGRSGYNWLGQISMFKVYGRALTASEVRSNFNAVKSRFGI